MEVLPDCQGSKETCFLRRDSHQPFYALRCGQCIFAKDFDRSGRGCQLGSDLSQESGFAGAVRAEDRDEFSALNLEIDPPIGLSTVLVSFDEAAHLDRLRLAAFVRLCDCDSPFFCQQSCHRWIVSRKAVENPTPIGSQSAGCCDTPTLHKDNRFCSPYRSPTSPGIAR